MKDLIKKILLEYVNHLDEDLGKPRKWSDESLRQVAKKYNTIDDFRRGDYNALNTARKKGKDFYKDITSHMVPKLKWTDDELRKELLKYDSLFDLRLNNINLYQAARKKGPEFFADVTSHLDKGWTDDKIRREVLNYDSLLELRQKNNKLYQAIYRKGTDYLKDVTSHLVKSSKWNDMALRDEAQKYNSRSEFQKQSPTAYHKARLRKDFFDDITSHMRKGGKSS